MRKGIILSVALLLVISARLFSQNINFDFVNYKPLQSQGVIPKDFLKVLETKLEEDKSTINQDEKRSVRKKKEKFILESNFTI